MSNAEESYTNIEVDNAELAKLNEDIAKVKAMIADRKSMYEGVPQPKTQVGWASYIANNDRGMLDKYQDAERQWYTLKEQERHAKELADAQRMQQDLSNMDDIMKNRAIAAANYQYAQKAVDLDHSGDPDTEAMLKQKEEEAKATLDYWNKRAGFNTDGTKTKEEQQKDEEDKDTPEEQQKEEESKDTPKEPEAEASTSRAADMADMDAYISGTKKFETDAEQLEFNNKVKAHPDYNIKGDYRDKVNKLEAVKSKESIKRAIEANKAKWRKEYNALSPLQQRKWKKNNPNKAKALGV